MDIQKWIMDILNSSRFMDIQKWFMDIQKSRWTMISPQVNEVYVNSQSARTNIRLSYV